jgi:flagellar biosynthesis protein FliQ
MGIDRIKEVEVKFIKKPSSTEQTIEDLPNIIAIVFAVVIFIATFLMGYFYSYLPQLFPK